MEFEEIPYQATWQIDHLGCIISSVTRPLAAFYRKLFTFNWTEDILIGEISALYQDTPARLKEVKKQKYTFLWGVCV